MFIWLITVSFLSQVFMWKDFFMNILNQKVIDEYVSKLKKNKYSNVLESLKMFYFGDDECPEIYISSFKIKKRKRCQGFGSLILQDIVQFAKEHNVQIKLQASDIYGTDKKILYKFYRKNGFVLVKNNKDGFFLFKNCNKKQKNNV